MAPRPLSCDALIGLLDSWVGRAVAVRVVSVGGELLAVTHGELGERSGSKRPAHFWPLEPRGTQEAARAETPGIYLHPERLEDARLHQDPTVARFTQEGVKLSLRLL